WERIIILLAGPFANFFLAFLLYFAIANLGVPKLLPIVENVGEETPAYHAGLKPGDKILQINTQPIRYWEEIGKTINTAHGALTLLADRNGTRLTLTLTPKIIEDKNIFGEPIKRRIIGITPSGDRIVVHYAVFDGLGYAWDETKKASLLIVQSVEKLLTGAVGTDKLGGVITIVDITAQASHQDMLALLFFTALISVNLGVLNLLPIPALDGGHIMFNLYEMLRGKEPSEKVIYYMTVTGWVILGGLMFLGLYNDINRLMG
ncbi:MAG: RIP metalloprotease RseP, partial [Sulfurovum sp.]